MDANNHISSANSPSPISPPLFGLPAELWGEIFSHSPPLPGNPFIRPSRTYSPLLVSQICSDWRNISLATPSLWSQLAVFIDNHTPIEFIALWLSRSKSFPLSLTVSWYTGNSTVSTAFFTLLASHIHHWRIVNFYMEPNTSFPPVIPPNGAPMLKEMSINVYPTNSKVFQWLCSVLHAAPQLEMVSEAKGVQLDLPWAQLSRIKLCNLSMKRGLDILAQTSKLIDCNFTFKSLPLQESIHRSNILLPHLSHLSVNVNRTGISLAPFFDHLTLPALKNFTGHGWFGRSFLSLLSRSPTCSLFSFHLSSTLISDSLLLECLRHPCIQSLSYLRIICTDIITDRILGYLTFRNGGVYSLPKLETLEFAACVQSTDGLIANMIISRCPPEPLPTGVSPLTRVRISGLDKISHEKDFSRLGALPICTFIY